MMLGFAWMVKYNTQTVADIAQTDTITAQAKVSPFFDTCIFIIGWCLDVARTVMCDAWIIMITAQIVI